MEVIIVFILANIPLYSLIYLVYRKDCKELGKENLAVPLSARLMPIIFIEIGLLISEILK